MTFPDVGGHWAEGEIERAVELGFFDGFPDGTFRPDEPVTRAQLAKVANRIYDAEPEPTERSVVWSTDFSDGFGDYVDSSPFSNSGNARGEVVDFDGGKAVAMSVVNADAGTGVRLRQDGATIRIPGFSGGENLPGDGWYSARFFIPEHVSITGGGNEDAWVVFQWKQTWPRTGGWTRRQLGGLQLRDLGDRYAFTYKSRIMDDGSFGQGATFQEWFSDAATVKAGEWFHVVARRVYSQDEGRVRFWVDGVEIFDLQRQTEFGWDYGGWRRQWTVNNYVTGNHSPNSHTLYVTDLSISV